jgi:hypothetical protein
MALSDLSDKALVAIIGLLVLLAPALLLGLTLVFLAYIGDTFVQGLSLLEILELYLIELVVVVVFGYGVYKLTKYLVIHQLPASLEELDDEDEN